MAECVKVIDHGIKPFAERMAEIDEYRDKVPRSVFYKMRRAARGSAIDLGEIPLKEESVRIDFSDVPAPPEIASPGNPTIEEIQQFVASQYKLSVTSLISHNRTMTIRHPRQVAIYLSRILTTENFSEIGRLFGYRDHTTIIYTVGKIGALVETDSVLAEEIAVLKGALLS